MSAMTESNESMSWYDNSYFRCDSKLGVYRTMHVSEKSLNYMLHASGKCPGRLKTSWRITSNDKQLLMNPKSLQYRGRSSLVWSRWHPHHTYECAHRRHKSMRRLWNTTLLRHSCTKTDWTKVAPQAYIETILRLFITVCGRTVH